MPTVVVAASRAAQLADDLIRAGVAVRAAVAPEHLLTGAAQGLLTGVDALVLEATAHTLTAELVQACDGLAVRIVPLCTGDDARCAASFGLAPVLPADADAWAIAETLTAPAAAPSPAGTVPRGQVITVWGPHGAPGRSTLAIEIASELSRGGRRVGLVDADSHAPSLALLLGLADEGPGFAVACRQAERGALDPAELDRICTPVPVRDGSMSVLPGINRPARWPELGERRVSAALGVCRDWAEYTVVDAAAALESDEEIVSDLTDGPRRNAAALAALRAADRIVAVLSADPVGVARFLRGYSELRAIVGAAPIAVVANKLRPGALGVDARGQVRRTLERFAGIRDVWFVPHDTRGVDAALLAARPMADVAPKSAVPLAVRRFAAEAIAPPLVLTRAEQRKMKTRPRMRVAEGVAAP